MEPTWKTRDGRVLKLTEMETTHLQHSMRMLERRRKALIDSPLGPVFALALVRAPNFELIGGEFARAADGIEAGMTKPMLVVDGTTIECMPKGWSVLEYELADGRTLLLESTSLHGTVQPRVLFERPEDHERAKATLRTLIREAATASKQ